jgi:hypothetical protein
MLLRHCARWSLLAFAACIFPPLSSAGDYLLIDQSTIDAARAKAAAHTWAARALDKLISDADRALAAERRFPDRGGQWPHWYSCKYDGVRLRTESATDHRCPKCNAVFHGEPFDSVPLYGVHAANSAASRDLGLAYRFTGKEEFARRAAAILTGYADRYKSYPLHDRFGEPKVGGGHVMAQTLDESVWLIPVTWSYALVRDTMDAGARAHVENDLLRPAAETIRMHRMGVHNIQCWKNTAVGLVGFVTGDKTLIADAIDDPERGFRTQIAKGVRDGVWWEGSLGYHVYTMQAIWPLAEAARMAGIDLYGDAYRSLYEGPLALALPNGDSPGFNDNAGGNLRHMASLYELAWLRWKQPAFGRLAADGNRNSVQSLLWGAVDVPSGDPVPVESRLLPEIGMAMLRSPALTAAVRYGSHGGGHGHPDKLNLVTFGGGRQLGLDPGSINYGVPLHAEWYRSTIAHNTVSVDEGKQSNNDGSLEKWKFDASGVTLVASAPAAFDGVLLRRSLVLSNSGRLQDRFECSSETERTWDWAFHAPGRLTTSVGIMARREPIAASDGYQHLTNVAAGKADGSWTARWESDSGPPLVLHIEPAAGTEVFTADGPGREPSDRVPVLIIRRRGKATTFSVTHSLEQKRAAQ